MLSEQNLSGTYSSTSNNSTVRLMKSSLALFLVYGVLSMKFPLLGTIMDEVVSEKWMAMSISKFSAE